MILKPSSVHRISAAAAAAILTATAMAAQTVPGFEVASIRPSADQPTQFSLGVRITGSQVRIGSFSLKDYIAMAFNVRTHQISGPDWLSSRFDIAATIPEGVPQSQVGEMMQRLLADRFKLVVHREQKEFPVYVLAVSEGGLKIKPLAAAENAPPSDAPVSVDAVGAGRSVTVALGGGSSFEMGNGRVQINRMTLSSLADMLTRFVDRPVVDETGVTGSFDITLPLTPEDYTGVMVRAALNNGIPLPPQALRALDAASGNPFAAPLADVGLRLDARRSMLDIIVVDSMERTPTEN